MATRKRNRLGPRSSRFSAQIRCVHRMRRTRIVRERGRPAKGPLPDGPSQRFAKTDVPADSRPLAPSATPYGSVGRAGVARGFHTPVGNPTVKRRDNGFPEAATAGRRLRDGPGPPQVWTVPLPFPGPIPAGGELALQAARPR